MSSFQEGTQLPAALFAAGAAPRALDRFTMRRPQVSFGLPFASISASSSSATQPGKIMLQKPLLTEPATGIAFPGDFCTTKATACPALAGMGVRAKRLLGIKNINVYAVGLYVEAPAAKRALSKYKAANAADLAANQAFFNDVISSDAFEKTLRLVISFGHVKRAQFVSALEERLAPALKAKGDDKSMAAFARMFDGTEFKQGLEIAFCHAGKGKLVTKIGGKQVSTIESPALCSALFDIYLGPDPVSPDAKASFAKGLAAMLSS